MTETVDVRGPDDGDIARIRDIAQSTLTASYALSPKELDGIVETRFDEDHIEERMDEAGTVLPVAEVDGPEEGRTLGGVVEGTVDGDAGGISWLFVDPELQGRGAGTALFEATSRTACATGAARPCVRARWRPTPRATSSSSSSA